jgi:hypothetical protein
LKAAMHGLRVEDLARGRVIAGSVGAGGLAARCKPAGWSRRRPGKQWRLWGTGIYWIPRTTSFDDNDDMP